MKVIYKPYMVRELMNIIHQAGWQNREIEKIVLTKAEADQLEFETKRVLHGLSETIVLGVPVEVDYTCSEKSSL